MPPAFKGYGLQVGWGIPEGPLMITLHPSKFMQPKTRMFVRAKKGTTVKEIDTESNSTIEPEADVKNMTDSQRTAKLYKHLLQHRPVNVMEKLPTLDDVRAIIASDFSNCDELWIFSAPKKVVSRSDFRLLPQ